MKQLLVFILAMLFVLSSALSAQTIDLDVKGVKIGTHRSEVIEKLGKPSSSKIGGSLPCDTDPVLNLRYPGLVLRLLESNEGKEFFVAEIEITSSNWTVASDINIGTTKKKVIKKFGFREVYKELDLEYLEYPMKVGSAEFSFKKDKLAKIAWAINPC
ncbi:MAG: hypothetical protein M3405_04755 [Acidobacteriota bacterium]|jgi:hypothetical protein|nr:hypothetical protein [Acidobacteriota bacterium]